MSLLAGFLGGWIDDGISRIIDTLLLAVARLAKRARAYHYMAIAPTQMYAPGSPSCGRRLPSMPWANPCGSPSTRP